MLPARSIASDGDTEVETVTTACLSELGFQEAGIKTARMWSSDARESRIQPGEILVARSNTAELVGRATLFNGSPRALVASDLIIRLRPRNGITAEFLAHYLSSLFISGYWRTKAGGASGTMKKITREHLENLLVPLPPTAEQQRVAMNLRGQIAEVDRAQAALQAKLNTARLFIQATLRESLNAPGRQTMPVTDCLQEVTEGIGEIWAKFPVLGATRAGLAPAKEGVGKNPRRYKPVVRGAIFYNPMRILLGSIAMLDDNDSAGITSPDYVVMQAVEGRLHPVWFYHWFRSPYGAEFILSLTRGAVRERLLFNRLAKASLAIPAWTTQLRIVEQLREIKAFTHATAARLEAIALLPAALLREAFFSPGSKEHHYVRHTHEPETEPDRRARGAACL